MGSESRIKKLFAINAKWVALAHTAFGAYAFASAFMVGIALHYKTIVENDMYKFPDEWLPSVSATIGDKYPERSVFQLLIAITSGPRFILVFLWFLLTRSASNKLPTWVFLAGLARTFACGGFVYITSTDDHDWHDISLIAYITLTFVWTWSITRFSQLAYIDGIGNDDKSSPNQRLAYKLRRRILIVLALTLIPLTHYFTQHKIYRVAGAYSKYSIFEWCLVVLDLMFDCVSVVEFEGLEIQVFNVGQDRKERDEFQRSEKYEA